MHKGGIQGYPGIEGGFPRRSGPETLDLVQDAREENPLQFRKSFILLGSKRCTRQQRGVQSIDLLDLNGIKRARSVSTRQSSFRAVWPGDPRLRTRQEKYSRLIFGSRSDPYGCKRRLRRLDQSGFDERFLFYVRGCERLGS